MPFTPTITASQVQRQIKDLAQPWTPAFCAEHTSVGVIWDDGAPTVCYANYVYDLMHPCRLVPMTWRPR